ncbi:MAG TPA: S8 family serine peptidase [Xanthomonadaceae bacterium]|nr:S8 family serine peptidase [Xanthomonadaceae bacterium]
MKSLLSTSIALALAAGAAGADATTTTTVIVEFEGDAGAVYMAKKRQSGTSVSETQLQNYRDSLKSEQDQVLQRIAASGIDADLKTVDIANYEGLPAATVQYRYTMVLNGVAVDVPVTEVNRIGTVPGVKRVHRPEFITTQLDRSVPFTRAPELYGGVAETGPFDDLREGYEGQGIHISVIDTGIEWHHEMFGGDLTPPRLGVLPSSVLVPENKKVVYQIPFGDPVVEDGFGHGTHVASTAGGYLGHAAGADGVPLTADDVPLHGVAPQTRLHSYSVCSTILSTISGLGLPNPLGGCRSETILLSLEDSVSRRTLTGFPKPFAHVINLSLGSPNGNPNGASAIAASNAALAGSIVVAAAGNSGNVPGIVGSPSVGTHVISVAASTDPGAAAAWFTDVLTPDGRQDIKVFPMAGTPAPAAGGISEQYVYVAGATTVAQWPASVVGKIALVRNGGAALFAETANNGALAGARAVLMISNTENATAVFGTIPAATIKPADADYLISLMDTTPVNGTVSTQQIRLEAATGAFQAEVAGFSSRGPVSGFGQVKPDLSAPGVNILAAVPPASLLGALGATANGVNYGAVSGTSMASPHVAGIAAQVKQANPSWTPDMVRTALINTATPMRDGNNNPDSFGSHNPTIHSQGGGLVDAFRAANARAMMGVLGDGIERPGILGSHSFANVPVLNNQCVSNEGVQAVLRDVRGQAGGYTLRVENNRGLELPGVRALVSPATVNVPANGQATFTASLELDSDAFAGESLAEFQWYVVAERSDGSETLSMPVYFRAVNSQPAIGGGAIVESRQYNGVIGAGVSEVSDQLGTDKTYLDVPIEIDSGSFRMVLQLEADAVTNSAYPDLDLFLLDPDGNQIGSSGNPGGVESIDAPLSGAGTYIARIENWLGADSSFTLTADIHSAGAGADPVTMQPVQTEYEDLSGKAIDFDGAFTVAWAAVGGETGFVLERSIDGGAWETVAELDGSQSSHAVENAAEGEHAYRVVSVFPGKVCDYLTPPSAAATLQVDYRQAVTIGGEGFTARITSASYQGDDFVMDMVITNDTGTPYLNPVGIEIVGIQGDASIVVLNADNGGDGRTTPAAFSYVDRIGADEAWSPGETSAARTIRFANPKGQLFTIDIMAKAYEDR